MSQLQDLPNRNGCPMRQAKRRKEMTPEQATLAAMKPSKGLAGVLLRAGHEVPPNALEAVRVLRAVIEGQKCRSSLKTCSSSQKPFFSVRSCYDYSIESKQRNTTEK